MFGLIAYAIGGVAILAGLYGFDHWRQGVGRDKQAEHDRPVMALCEQFPSKGIFGGEKASDPADCAKGLRDALALGQQAQTANASLQADLSVLDQQRKTCSSAVSRLQKQGEAAAAASAARKPQDDRLLTLIQADRERLILDLQTVGTKVRTCQQQLAERDAAWQATAKQRQRDFPATVAPSGDVNIKPPK